MQTEYLLYGIPEGETERHTEALLTCTTDPARIDAVQKFASADGFHSFRTAKYNGEAPNFAKAIRQV